MNAYYCGFNGFGQFPDKNIDAVSIYPPIPFPLELKEVAFAWNYLFCRTENEAYLSGLVNGRKGNIQQLFLPTGEKILRGSCCTKHALFIAEDGCCWKYKQTEGWKNISSILNAENVCHSEVQEECQQLEAPKNHDIIQICCEEKLSFALNNFGQVYNIPSVLRIPARKVTQIACGFEHCLMLTDASTVYSWGSGRRGQLGHEVLEDEEIPREIEMLSGLQIKSVAAGGWHSVAITYTGDMYVWGWNTSGQLGMPCSETKERLPQRVSEKSFLDDGKITSNMPIKEEHKETATVVAVPTPVYFSQNTEERIITHAACGNRHTIIITDDGSAWGCGWNAYGQLGLSDWSLYEELTKIIIKEKENCKVTDVICGSWSTVLFVGT